MKTYRVKWLEEVWVEVDAETPEEAKDNSQRYLAYINRHYGDIVPNTLKAEELKEENND